MSKFDEEVQTFYKNLDTQVKQSNYYSLGGGNATKAFLKTASGDQPVNRLDSSFNSRESANKLLDSIRANQNNQVNERAFRLDRPAYNTVRPVVNEADIINNREDAIAGIQHSVAPAPVAPAPMATPKTMEQVPNSPLSPEKNPAFNPAVNKPVPALNSSWFEPKTTDEEAAKTLEGAISTKNTSINSGEIASGGVSANGNTNAGGQVQNASQNVSPEVEEPPVFDDQEVKLEESVSEFNTAFSKKERREKHGYRSNWEPLQREAMIRSVSSNQNEWLGTMENFFMDGKIGRALLIGGLQYGLGKAAGLSDSENALLGLEGAVKAWTHNPDKERTIQMVEKFGEFVLPEDSANFEMALAKNDFATIAALGQRGFYHQNKLKDFVDKEMDGPEGTGTYRVYQSDPENPVFIGKSKPTGKGFSDKEMNGPQGPGWYRVSDKDPSNVEFIGKSKPSSATEAKPTIVELGATDGKPAGKWAMNADGTKVYLGPSVPAKPGKDTKGYVDKEMVVDGVQGWYRVYDDSPDTPIKIGDSKPTAAQVKATTESEGNEEYINLVANKNIGDIQFLLGNNEDGEPRYEYVSGFWGGSMPTGHITPTGHEALARQKALLAREGLSIAEGQKGVASNTDMLFMRESTNLLGGSESHYKQNLQAHLLWNQRKLGIIDSPTFQRRLQLVINSVK